METRTDINHAFKYINVGRSVSNYGVSRDQGEVEEK